MNKPEPPHYDDAFIKLKACF